MKKVFKPFMVAASFAGLVATSSCTKTCDPGYEGTDCKTEVREKLLGRYSVSETCQTTGAAEYLVEISKASDVQEVYIEPFGGYTGYTAKVKYDNSTITLVSVSPSTGQSFSGLVANSADGTTITATYSVTGSDGTESCTGTWSKQ